MQDLVHLLYDYAEKYSTSEDEILTKIDRHTHLSTLSPRMLSGNLQGKFLTLLSTLSQPKIILEIGTFTGYSAVCLAKGLAEGGKLITLEYNPEHADLASFLISGTEYQDKIEVLTGDAMDIIPELDYTFDMVFIDADKEAYSAYYDMVFPKCNKGAIIIADNVLWNGKVVDEHKDKKTRSLHKFNIKVSQDPRVENLILPLRDGLNIIVKK